MEKFKKMGGWEFAIFFLMAICAGAIIGIGGVAMPCIILMKEGVMRNK